MLNRFLHFISNVITIHKSRGLSRNAIVLDIGNLIFSSGQTYVALSRITPLKGLSLINFDPKSIMADPEAIIKWTYVNTQKLEKDYFLLIARLTIKICFTKLFNNYIKFQICKVE